MSDKALEAASRAIAGAEYDQFSARERSMFSRDDYIEANWRNYCTAACAAIIAYLHAVGEDKERLWEIGEATLFHDGFSDRAVAALRALEPRDE